MAKLTAAQRRKLPNSAFAYSKARRYPIHTPGHRKAALREASKSTTFGTYAHVKRRINQRLGRKTTTTKTSRRRKKS